MVLSAKQGLTVAAALFAAACSLDHVITSSGLPPIDILGCGGWGAALDGVDILLPPAETTELHIEDRLVVAVNVGQPIDGSTQCPSRTGGKTHFPRITWSWGVDGPIEVRLLSCPCSVERSWDSGLRRNVVATSTGTGTFTFEIVGRKPGGDLFSVDGLVEGPCSNGPGVPPDECGPYASDRAAIRVVE